MGQSFWYGAAVCEMSRPTDEADPSSSSSSPNLALKGLLGGLMTNFWFVRMLFKDKVVVVEFPALAPSTQTSLEDATAVAVPVDYTVDLLDFHSSFANGLGFSHVLVIKQGAKALLDWVVVATETIARGPIGRTVTTPPSQTETGTLSFPAVYRVPLTPSNATTAGLNSTTGVTSMNNAKKPNKRSADIMMGSRSEANDGSENSNKKKIRRKKTTRTPTAPSTVFATSKSSSSSGTGKGGDERPRGSTGAFATASTLARVPEETADHGHEPEGVRDGFEASRSVPHQVPADGGTEKDGDRVEETRRGWTSDQVEFGFTDQRHEHLGSGEHRIDLKADGQIFAYTLVSSQWPMYTSIISALCSLRQNRSTSGEIRGPK